MASHRRIVRISYASWMSTRPLGPDLQVGDALLRWITPGRLLVAARRRILWFLVQVIFRVGFQRGHLSHPQRLFWDGADAARTFENEDCNSIFLAVLVMGGPMNSCRRYSPSLAADEWDHPVKVSAL